MIVKRITCSLILFLTMFLVKVCAKYFNYVSMLMMGTFLVAESVEACGLHRRIALKILSLLGAEEIECHTFISYKSLSSRIS